VLTGDHQQVILPDLNAGCSMADMADLDEVEEAWDALATVTDIERVVPIPSAVHTELLAYLLERRGKRGSLFRTDVHHAPLSSKEASAVVIAAAERAGIAWKVTPKTLRHSYATHLMDRGVDLAVIAALMGHRTPAETGVYLHVLPQRPREAVDRLAREEGDRE